MKSLQLALTLRLCVFVFALVQLSRSSDAQVISPSNDNSKSADRKETCKSVIEQLETGNLEGALKSLEPLADGPELISLEEDDDLSSASACLHRALSQISSEAQFELLSKWSVAAGSPPRIRTLTTLVPTTAPPMEFARALGERPRNHSFPISSIGEVRGIFNTGWSLVLAARDSGRLKGLIADLRPMADRNNPHADLLLSMALVADGRGDMTSIGERLSQRLLHIKQTAAHAAAGMPKIDPANIVLAAVALQHPSLQRVGEEMFGALVEDADGQPAARIRPFLRRAHAISILHNQQDSAAPGIDAKLSPRLKYWTTVSSNSTESSFPSAGEPIWVAQDDYLLHLGGPGRDVLIFRYPLQGTFQFECEIQLGGRIQTNGGLIFGGFGIDVGTDRHELRLTNADGSIIETQYCHFLPNPVFASFHRFSVSSTPTSVSVAINGHPIRMDQTGLKASPWLGLQSQAETRPLFRNFKFTGQPVIPRSVNLIEGTQLRGWQAPSFGEHPALESAPAGGWRNIDGLLLVKSDSANAIALRSPQVLAYQRPLLEAEAVSYEFFHEPGAYEVSPALGRVAFLLHPEGIRIRWLTDGQREWTGLAADNAVTEPLHRRGPRPLPLNVNDWNRMTVSRSGGNVTLSLNDVAIYQRPVDWSGDHRFGFYLSQSNTRAKVRNVVLSGDWPETAPQEFLDHPLTAVGEQRTAGERLSFNRIIQDEYFADNVFAVRRKALSMSVEDRFDYLSQWILPGPDHAGFRIAGDITPSQPAPSGLDAEQPEMGARIVSPVFDWLDAAKELGRLAECQTRVATALVSADEYQQRAQLGLLILLNLAKGSDSSDVDAFDAFYGLLRAQTVMADNQWPEMLVISRLSRNVPIHDVAAKFLSDIRTLKTQQPQPWRKPLWHAQMASLVNRSQSTVQAEGDINPGGSAGRRDWIPVTAETAASRGQGFPRADWQHGQQKAIKLAAHGEDYLFYKSPLIGDFELEFDVRDMTQIMIGGSYISPLSDRKHLLVGTFRSVGAFETVEPPFSPFGSWIHCRAVIRDRTRTISFNGRQVKSDELPKNADPWIAIRCAGPTQGGVRDFRITGRPQVLDVVSMSNSKELTGWISYHDEAVPHETYGWAHVDDTDSSGWIVGHFNPGVRGMSIEGLLRYQRPLIENGRIDYEFYYDPDHFEVHPVLDRLAFILHPSGVREHWITDGRHDRTNLSPQNMTDNPTCRRGPSELPLKASTWNQLRLQRDGMTIFLELNGKRIYERRVEPANNGAFGLFHFLGDTAVRVRNVEMSGDWPKTSPAPNEQELADQTIDAIEEKLKGLKAVFSHDFRTDGAPDKYFRVPVPSSSVSVMKSTEGLQLTQRMAGPHTGFNLTPRFTLSGDFDIEASFTGLRVESTGDSGVMLNATLDEPLRHEYRALRMKSTPGTQELHTSICYVRADGGRSYVGSSMPFEATSGRIRFVRLDHRVHYLFAEGDSQHFFQFGEEEASNAETAMEGLFLHSFGNGIGLSQITWTKLVLRADRIKWRTETPQPIQELLSVMNADGTSLHTIASARSVGFKSISAPEWSADGLKLVMEMSNGTPETSHVFIVNADGTELKDLGPGCMPSFSQLGNKIVFSQPRKGIVTMKPDGTDRKVFAATGWGAQWSPDGLSIAYGEAGNITIRNVSTRTSAQLLRGETASRYRSIINLGWSHDSQSIAFKAERRDLVREELSIAELGREDRFQVLHPNAHAVSTDITFSPDNQQVIVSIQKVARPDKTLYSFSRETLGPPEPFPAALSDHQVSGCAWSHDGKLIAITSQHTANYVEWIKGPISTREQRIK